MNAHSKILVFLIAGVLFCGVLMTSCKKDNDNNNGGGQGDDKKNYLEYAGKSHPIEEALQLYYGDYYGTNTNNITLAFVTDKHYVLFEMFVPLSNKKLVTGTYKADDTGKAFTIAGGKVLNADFETVYEMIDGIITIEVSGSVYTINMEGMLDDGSKAKGYFNGEIDWSDESDGDDEGDDYGSMTITDGSNQQTINFNQAQLLRAATSTSNRFVVYFSGTYMVTFGVSDLTATTLPSGTYPVSTTAPIPEGASGVVLSLPGSGVLNANKGSFKVQKNGSDYSITFNFITDSTPALTATGYYNGTLPLSGTKRSLKNGIQFIKNIKK